MKSKEEQAMKNKTKLAFTKAFDIPSKSLTALVSTYEWDRTNERFAQGAWNLEAYKQNPVVLWGHDNGAPPIAKTVDLVETDKGLQATMLFDSGSERAMDIYRLYTDGFLNAFSVGFVPKNWKVEPIDGTQEKGVVFTDAELLEYSAVSIPANPGALISRDMADFVMKCLGPDSLKPVADKDGFFMVSETEEKPETKSEPEPESLEPVEDFEKSLRYLVDLAKTAKGAKVEQSKLDLIQQAITVLSEIVEANREGVDAEVVKQLQESIEGLAKAVETLLPDNAVLLQKVMAQIDKALRGNSK
jgi:HK97 family phage prohead protease